MGVCAAALTPLRREEPAATFAPPRPKATWPADPARRNEDRTQALHRATVWRPSDVTAASFENPPDPNGTLSQPIVRCRFVSKAAHGTTTKFDCALPDGEVVKIKYGITGEIHAEIAASRLLRALGFGADRMYLVPRVRCYGCPQFPFYTAVVLDWLHAREWLTTRLPDNRFTDFEWVAVERRLEGAPIERADGEGWAWYELESIDPAAGASRAEIDALRAVSMFLHHWDNKAANQRLVCLASPASGVRPCPSSFAYIQDLGATFGPNKMDLQGWTSTPLWADAARCTLSMRTFPYHGGTFPDVSISEAGRQLLARQLRALSDAQVETLFRAARFHEFFGTGPAADIASWTRAFHDKVRQIDSAGPCPS